MKLRRRLLAAGMMLLASMPSRVKAQADTIGSPIALFTYRDAVLAGSVALTTVLARRLDDRAADVLQDPSRQANAKLHGISAFVRLVSIPGSTVIGPGLYAVGRLSGNRKLADLGLHGTEALFAGEAVAGLVKGVVGRQRPSMTPRNSAGYGLFRGFRENDDYRSFPSGHTVAAFAAAAAVTSETSRYSPDTKWIVGTAMFGGAALAGLSRMYDNRHWASDVVAGAGIGTFAGLKVVRYQHSHPGGAIDRLFLVGSLSPTPDGRTALRWSLEPRRVRWQTPPRT